MPANSYRFVEYWWIPGASPEEVYETISQARLLPEWWKGVYLEAEPLDGAPKVLPMGTSSPSGKT